MGGLLSTTTRSTTAAIINHSDADVTVTPIIRSVAQEVATVEPHKQRLITIPCESSKRTHEIDKLRFQIMKGGELIRRQDININGLDLSPENLRFAVDPVSYIVNRLSPGQDG